MHRFSKDFFNDFIKKKSTIHHLNLKGARWIVFQSLRINDAIRINSCTHKILKLLWDKHFFNIQVSGSATVNADSIISS